MGKVFTTPALASIQRQMGNRPNKLPKGVLELADPDGLHVTYGFTMLHENRSEDVVRTGLYIKLTGQDAPYEVPLVDIPAKLFNAAPEAEAVIAAQEELMAQEAAGEAPSAE